MTSSVTAFKTYVNPVLRAVRYTAGIVSGYSASTYDANGNQTRYAYYNAAGADETWFTDDDVLSSQSRYDTSF
jgi:hypothetical protein